MAESELKRTHPATVIVRSVSILWQSAIGLLFVFIAGGIGRSAPILLLGVAVFLGVLIGVGTSWVNWMRFGYGIQGDDLVVVEGLWVRKRRVIPVSRVHGVNVRADLLMRILGVVEVVVQTAGGGSTEPEAKIGAITLSEAESLRAALLHTGEDPAVSESGTEDPAALGLAAAVQPSIGVGADPLGRMSDFRGAFAGRQAHAHVETFEHRVTTWELALAAITSNRVPIMLAVFVGVAAQSVEVVGLTAVEETAGAAARLAIPVLVGFALLTLLFTAAIAVAVAVVRDYGFVARRIGQRVEVEAGLLERRLTGIPVTRVQSVRIEESWLRKLLGLATIYVDTAGITHDQQATGGSTAMIPALRIGELDRVMHGLLPEAEEFPVSPGLPTRALRFHITVPTATALLVGLPIVVVLGYFWTPGYVAGGTALAVILGITASIRALAWHAAGIGTDERAMTMQTGILGRSRIRISRTHIQSLSVTQNPFQRRASLATITADSVSGSSHTRHRVRHIEEDRAMRLLRWYQSVPGAPVPPRAPQPD